MTTKQAIKALYQAREAIDKLLTAYEEKQAGSTPKPAKKTPSAASHDLRFEDWYKVYPRKTAKANARASWARLKLDPRADELIDILHRTIKSGTWRELKFTPHPATYLNQERYNDPIEGEITSKPLTAEEILRKASR